MNRHELTALHDMTLFVEVGRTLSFRKASKNLGLPPATLSRRISALEDSLGQKLFHRSTRNVMLSDAGRSYFERCEHLVDEALFIVRTLNEKAQLPAGHLRISVPVDLGIHILGPLIPEFSKKYPDITFDFDLSSNNKDMILDGLDIAIRLSPTDLAQNNSQQIGSISMGLYANPTYLATRGMPLKPNDLLRHICLTTNAGATNSTWSLQHKAKKITREIRVNGVCNTNNLGMIRVLCEHGMGICQLANVLAIESVQSGKLEKVLANWQPLPLYINAITPSTRRSASVDAMLDYLSLKMTHI